MGKRKKPTIHHSIKQRLGYDLTESDDNVYKDWKERTSRVCKPCWELKYCPYGPLVEQSPLLPGLKGEAEDHVLYLKNCVETGIIGEKKELPEFLKENYLEWVKDDQILLRQALNEIANKRKIEEAGKKDTPDEQINEWLGSGLPPIHVYRVPYEVEYTEISEENFPKDLWLEILSVAEKNRTAYILALQTGEIDTRGPLEPARRAWFEKVISEHDPDSLPEAIPETFTDAACNIFGHICPVFFAAEGMTETEEARRIGRKQLNFKTMMRIVRRDNYECQHCQKRLRDDEVEFDHIIPVAKGGSSEEHNLRLTCYDCNRDKSDDYVP